MRAYLSHTIRGQKGNDATDEDMSINCNAALEVGTRIRKLIPQLGLHIPAEHEEFVSRAYRNGYMNEKEILDVDCQIINDCDLIFILVKDGWIGGGIGVEIKYAQKQNIPIYFIFDNEIDEIIEMVVNDFKN